MNDYEKHIHRGNLEPERMPSEYESLRKDLDGIASSMERYAAAVGTYTEAATGEITRLWADNAALRDDLHVLANRVETLTRARLTEPAETAEAMVRKHGVPCSECGVPVYVDHLDPQLPSPIRNAADGEPHTCDADAANVRRMARGY